MRSLVPVISKYEVEEILSSVASLIIEDSTSFNVLHAASETLLVACEKHPDISPEKVVCLYVGHSLYLILYACPFFLIIYKTFLVEVGSSGFDEAY